jgi:hypothetical protein|nr:MAG TPA: GROUP II INTRON-ENCODED PROTEIN LTRA/RNA, GROUP II INTRONS, RIBONUCLEOPROTEIN.8A [Caudoviricetes sp.]
MKNLIGQKNNDSAKQPSSDNEMMYGCSVGASSQEVHGMPSHVEDANQASKPCTSGEDKSAGKEKALVVGCNANNANASARTANCNNAVSNGNDNYAGAFAVKQVENTNMKHLAARSTRSNIAQNHAATGGHGADEVSSLPFWTDDIADSCSHELGSYPLNATLEGKEAEKEAILQELDTVSRKRKLQNLKRFIANPIIVRMGVERCLSRASDSPEVRKAIRNKEKIISRLIRELTDGTYRCQPTTRRIITKRGKGDKDRNADIYTVYDRCVQNILLIVLQQKLTNKLSPWCYSGIKGRSLWSNDKTYCMVNRIRTYVQYHPQASVGLTDIRHFYESLHSEVVLGVLFDTITCPYTRSLLCDILLQTETLVIGGTLSQIFAMLTLTEMDYEINRIFHPQFYGAFGDNRIIMDDDREKVIKAVHWEMSYLEGRYGMHMKNDYQIARVANGFMFCKQHFKGSFVNVRAEIRRRAIRGAIRGQQHYAGYHGMLVKTDSRKLIYLIKNKLNSLRMKNQKGMMIKPMAGELIKLNKVEGKTIYITDYAVRKNNKDSEYFVRFQFVVVNDDGSKCLYVTNNGSFEIKEFFKLVENGSVSLPVKTRICSEGTSYYFEQFHTSNQEACNLICEQLGI